MNKALANAFILCGYIFDYNEKNKDEDYLLGTKLNFEVRYNPSRFKGIDVLVNRHIEILERDLEAIVKANDLLKGTLTVTKTGEVNVKFS